ncbi:YqcC family protein [Pseudomonas sp. 2FE]|uniref:YqcC family protein n=1 Tax=Pseudomonas sp. 2FE TaxID=2502190 RepID=UPI0010F47840|nr:YqcC family protein [Pseudomonas sp. 2FE]
MDARLSLLAEQLLLIERELRLQGWWAAAPPSAEALASEQPFCVDSLAFEEWLQWVFLPRMKVIVECGKPLPTTSGIRPMAEVVYSERSAKAKTLLELLGEFDRLIGGAA